MTSLTAKLIVAAGFALGACALSASTASATPMANAGVATQGATEGSAQIEQARWVCGYYGRCWWRPGPRYYGGYGFYGRPRPFYGHRWGYRHYRHW